MNMFSPRLKWRLAAALAAFFSLYLTFYETWPRAREVLDRRSQLSEKELQIEAAQSWKSRLGKIKSAKKRLKSRVARSVSSEEVSLLAALRETAGRSGATLKELAPGEASERSAYYVQGATARVEGSFHEVASLMAGLEAGRPFISVRELVLEAVGPRSSRLEATLELEVMRLKRAGRL